MAETNLLTLKNGNKWGAALAVEFKRQVKKSQEEVMREFVKNLVTEIIGVTPPQSGKFRKGTAAKKRGEQTVENQIRRVFQGVNKTQADKDHFEYNNSMFGMNQIHERARVKGLVRKGSVRNRRKVMKGRLNRYIRMKKANVGLLAAGWHAAADEFGVRGRNFPMWMRRHQGRARSSAKISIKKDNIHVKFSNRVRYAGEIKIMKQRLSRAMGAQASKTQRKKMRKGLKEAVRKSKILY